MKRYFIVLAVALCCTVGTASAQTPVEKVIREYADVKGARDFIASGGEMVLARSLIRRTPLAAIASEVDVLEVLKMQNASSEDIGRFEASLAAALASYRHYGKAETKNGQVDVYISSSDADTVSELVIYNPAIYSLNSLKGSLSASRLLEIRLDE